MNPHSSYQPGYTNETGTPENRLSAHREESEESFRRRAFDAERFADFFPDAQYAHSYMAFKVWLSKRELNWVNSQPEPSLIIDKLIPNLAEQIHAAISERLESEVNA